MGRAIVTLSPSRTPIVFNAFALENKDKIKVVSIKPSSIKTPIWNKSVKSAHESFNELSDSVKVKYQNEILALEKNALKNNKKGLDVKRVTKTVLKVIKSNNPKTSYNVGFAACFAEMVSHLPLKFLNFFIRIKIKNL